MSTLSTPPTPALPVSRVPSLAVSIGVTAAAAIALILANKLVGYTGRAAGLKDACWQLTTVRATLAATTVVSLISFRKDHLLLLGALYGLSLALTHGGAAGLFCAVAAGGAAVTLRHVLADRAYLRLLLPALAFVAVLATTSLLSKTAKLGTGPALAAWTPDVALRLIAAGVAATALYLLLPSRAPSR